MRHFAAALLDSSALPNLVVLGAFTGCSGGLLFVPRSWRLPFICAWCRLVLGGGGMRGERASRPVPDQPDKPGQSNQTDRHQGVVVDTVGWNETTMSTVTVVVVTVRMAVMGMSMSIVGMGGMIVPAMAMLVVLVCVAAVRVISCIVPFLFSFFVRHCLSGSCFERGCRSYGRKVKAKMVNPATQAKIISA